MLRILAGIAIALILALQFKLWLGDGGMREVWHLRAQVAAQRAENERLQERNRTLLAEVQDLKQGQNAIEERARTDLGMVAGDETFYQVMSGPSKAEDKR